MNWWKLDPLFTIRMWFHLGHPNSPLSHPSLTRRVFFHGPVSDAYMEEFQSHINPYECFWWPLAMMRPFASFRASSHKSTDGRSVAARGCWYFEASTTS